ncbi:DUF5703 domain-containing protein [Paraflavisolibacter sp. H34]|uniref:DUF5703 domain-containing protein n=1 Tax=Huijunlia imazamoxiresistens TaxID=3127457 RepID=UPI00301B5ED7
MKRLSLISFLLIAISHFALAQTAELDACNVVWNSQSNHSGESMPCGGGDIGLNVWVEKGEVLFYFARSGSFDENNALLKGGRVRLRLTPNPFAGKDFRQELVLKDGFVQIAGSNGTAVKVWVDVFRPVIHLDVTGNTATKAEAVYESWRHKDRVPVKIREYFGGSYKWAPKGDVRTRQDQVAFEGNSVVFYHRNQDTSVFDVTVRQQGLDKVKDSLWNPLGGRTFGGVMQGNNFIPAGTATGSYLGTEFGGWKLESRRPARSHNLQLVLHTAQVPSAEVWKAGLRKAFGEALGAQKGAFAKTTAWWQDYWKKSFIFMGNGQGETAQVGRNYQLFRYMLGCNASGAWPTKFNGGLFTYDPSLTDTAQSFTPDYRNWGGGTHTAQNQRLVYFPLLKSGDFDLMQPQFDFYRNLLRNAELRTQTYWGHKGACFTEQLESFGLPNPAEYGWNRPASFDKGLEYNAWLEYEWDTVLEFCLMMLETERYAGKDISGYLPFIESCLTFFNEHYQQLARQRGRQALDGAGKLVLYPGSGAETYKMAYNSTSTIAALQTVLTRLLELPENYLGKEKRAEWSLMLQRIPPISFREFDGHRTLSPAQAWERINNTEVPQLYPVFPWGLYGVGKPGLDIARNTWNYDTSALRFRSHVGWKQDNIFAARLGLTDEAARLAVLKLKDSGRRFPAFWGPGFDWTPDHNWGGSGAIGLQEMLLQTDGKKIFLFPAWPKSWNVHFKLHAPYNTTVEATMKDGKVTELKVLPESRKKDIILP